MSPATPPQRRRQRSPAVRRAAEVPDGTGGVVELEDELRAGIGGPTGTGR